MDDLLRHARACFRAAVRGAGADVLLDAFPWAEAVRRPLGRYAHVRLVALGKAALAMTGVVARQLRAAGTAIEEGVAVVPEGYAASLPERFPKPPPAVPVLAGGHPVPTAVSVRAGLRALKLAERSTASDLLIVLVSGGGTSLCNAFAGDLPLADVRRTFRLLLESGADIHAANTVRKRLTRVGGGRLAQAAAPAEVLALAVSDVLGDDLATIASGPTVPDPASGEEAEAILRTYGLWPRLPESVRHHLHHSASLDAPGADDPCFQNTRTCLVGSNRDALRAAGAEAEAAGYAAEVRADTLKAEAREWGRRLASEALARAGAAGARCLLLGGETTVTVRGQGTGGRSQELALAAALELERAPGAPVAVLAGGTDGIDGPTDAAGAVATPGTAGRIRAAGLDPAARLADNDAHPALRAAGALLHPGPTHTNVMDIAGAFAAQ